MAGGVVVALVALVRHFVTVLVEAAPIPSPCCPCCSSLMPWWSVVLSGFGLVGLSPPTSTRSLDAGAFFLMRARRVGLRWRLCDGGGRRVPKPRERRFDHRGRRRRRRRGADGRRGRWGRRGAGAGDGGHRPAGRRRWRPLARRRAWVAAGLPDNSSVDGAPPLPPRRALGRHRRRDGCPARRPPRRPLRARHRCARRRRGRRARGRRRRASAARGAPPRRWRRAARRRRRAARRTPDRAARWRATASSRAP